MITLPDENKAFFVETSNFNYRSRHEKYYAIVEIICLVVYKNFQNSLVLGLVTLELPNRKWLEQKLNCCLLSMTIYFCARNFREEADDRKFMAYSHYKKGRFSGSGSSSWVRPQLFFRFNLVARNILNYIELTHRSMFKAKLILPNHFLAWGREERPRRYTDSSYILLGSVLVDLLSLSNGKMADFLFQVS